MRGNHFINSRYTVENSIQGLAKRIVLNNQLGPPQRKKTNLAAVDAIYFSPPSK